MKYSKKTVGILMAVAVSATTMMGCTKVDDTAVAVTVGEETVSMGVANFYARFQGAMTETYYGSMLGGGDAMWSQDIGEGKTYEDTVKDQAMTTLQNLTVVKQHAEELGVELTEEELAAIEAAAEEFYAANAEDVRTQVSGTKENVVEMLTLFAIDNKCRPIIIEDADREVSDDEAAQKKMTYVSFPFSSTNDAGESVDLTEDEKVALKEEVEALLADAKKEKDLLSIAEAAEKSPLETTFDAESTSINADVLAAVESLKKDEFTSVIETETGYYIAQLTSEFDQEATDDKKESIILERENALYDSTVQEWVDAVEITVNDKEWNKVSFEKLGVTMVIPETEVDADTAE